MRCGILHGAARIRELAGRSSVFTSNTFPFLRSTDVGSLRRARDDELLLFLAGMSPSKKAHIPSFAALHNE